MEQFRASVDNVYDAQIQREAAAKAREDAKKDKITTSPQPGFTPRRSSSYDDSDPYDAGDYAHPDDFYYDHYDDFFDYEESEEYYDEYGDY